MQVGNQMVENKQEQHTGPNPASAGKNDHLPMEVDCSMAGISRLQIDAATITPAANPARERCTKFPSGIFMKNTQVAPSVVPTKESEFREPFLFGSPPFRPLNDCVFDIWPHLPSSSTRHGGIIENEENAPRVRRNSKARNAEAIGESR